LTAGNRTSRRQRGVGKRRSSGGGKVFWVVVLAIVLAVAVYVFWDRASNLMKADSTREIYPPEQYESLKDAIVATSLAFGINPDDIIWADGDNEEASEFAGDMQEVKISPFYPKTMFHLELIENLAATDYVIEDCVEIANGLSLEFSLINLNKSRFKFRLVSDKGTLPRASHLAIIIDKIQSQRRDVQQGLSGLGVMYSFILSPGMGGFAEMRKVIQVGGQQILYEVPLERNKFIRDMNGLAHLVGLKRIGNLDQAVYVMELLAGDFKYLFKRDPGLAIDKDLAESLGKSGFIIFAESEMDEIGKEAFLRAGGKMVGSLSRTKAETVERLYSTLLEYHRKMLFSDNWGAMIVEADGSAAEGLEKAAKQLSRLNCKVTPISQLVLRAG